jgi:sucrose-6-phosphate hydrolase SacC (GH32 family)
MVMPRMLTIGADGHPRQNPAPEFNALRGNERTIAARSLEDRTISLREAASGRCLEIEAEFEATSARSVGFRVRCSGDGSRGTEVSYSRGSGLVTVGQRTMFAGRDKTVSLRVFLDKRVMEVYANGGAAAMFTAVDAGPEDTGVEIFARGGTAEVRQIRAWAMKPAKFSLEGYRTA